MASKTIDVIQSILEYLDKSMDDDEIDITPISHESLNISYARWCRIIEMMLEEGLIDGFIETTTLGSKHKEFIHSYPRITLQGIRFLSDNSNLSKLYRAAKELRDWIPGI